jgi:hypothetical protein
VSRGRDDDEAVAARHRRRAWDVSFASLFTLVGLLGLVLWIGLVNTAAQDKANGISVALAVVGTLSGPALVVFAWARSRRAVRGMPLLRFICARFAVWGVVSLALIVALTVAAP